mgnify:FL=1
MKFFYISYLNCILFLIFQNDYLNGIQLNDIVKLNFHDSLINSHDDSSLVNYKVLIKKPDITSLNTKIYFGSEVKAPSTFNHFDLHLKGNISKIYFHINPIIVNSINKEYIGSKYSRSNISARFDNSYIEYKYDIFKLKVGRSTVNWGGTNNYSIIQSGLSPGYDHIGLKIKSDHIEYDLINGQLSSLENNIYGRVKRFISGKKIKFIFNDKLSFGFGDQIIYTGPNRSIELHYLNPFAPYFLAGLEKEEEESFLDNDNSILFFFGKFKYKDNLSFFTEFLIDDFQIDNTGRSNKLGLKIGLNGFIPIFENILSFYIDFSFIQPSTYMHSGLYTNWDNLDYNLGSVFGSGSNNYFYQFVYHFSKNTKLLFEFNDLSKNTTEALDNEISNYERTFFYDVSIIKKYSNTIFKVGKKNLDFPYGLKKDLYQLNDYKIYFSIIQSINLDF